MKEFIPIEKMSKKAKRELARARRQTWTFSPVSRRIESKKHYNRKKKSHDRYDNGSMGLVFCSFMAAARICRPHPAHPVRHGR